jgi:hypothetical protein
MSTHLMSMNGIKMKLIQTGGTFLSRCIFTIQRPFFNLPYYGVLT